MTDLQSAGLPHSEIPGSKLAYSSPRLIAVRHVLHRHLVRRHPPYALCAFTIYYIILCVILSLSLAETLYKTIKDLGILKVYYVLKFNLMVENDGFEPTASALQKQRSTN